MLTRVLFQFPIFQLILGHSPYRVQGTSEEGARMSRQVEFQREARVTDCRGELPLEFFSGEAMTADVIKLRPF